MQTVEHDKPVAPANDMKAAESTYSSFIVWLKWSVPIIAVIAFIVLLLIA
ncbi:aa3-type cytochrome c oxidase subunit IV [Altericroceibacterium xinjiangense]|nr:aa3-type cytochrome c oxidase subunit IV [Altericroceibacterium xinjiangense]